MKRDKNISGLKLATIKDKPTILKIVTSSFGKDPGIQWMLASSKNPYKLNILMEYLVDEIMHKGFIYLTENNLGAALWSTEKIEKLSLNFIKRNFMMLFKLRISTIIRILKFQKISHKQLPHKSPYVYLVNLAVLPEARGKGLASKLMNPIIEHCTKENISIYLETSNPTNVDIYSKKGFSLINKINFGLINFFYMKKNPTYR